MLTSPLESLHLEECINHHKLAQKLFETYSDLPGRSLWTEALWGSSCPVQKTKWTSHAGTWHWGSRT